MKSVKIEDFDLIVYDFDGVMTDNRVYLDQHGVESVVCNRADGLGVDMLRRAGIPQLILSTETNSVVGVRARKLKLEVLQGVADKRQALLDFCTSRQYDLRRVLYVGNDENDLEAMQAVGHAVCPADAHAVVRGMADLVTTAVGGEGVVRELAQRLLEPADALPAGPVTEAAEYAAYIRQEFQDAARLRLAMVEDVHVLSRVNAIAQTMADRLAAGGRIFFAGNGGSFADAQHIAAEFVGRFMCERPPLAAVCLGTNVSTVTAVGNDYSFEDVFVRELRALARQGDVLVGLSTSGNSSNLVAAIETALEIRLEVFAFLGKGGGRIAKLVPSIVVPSDNTARIQEMHITLGHIICGLVDLIMSDRRRDAA